jgi:hypothetical protein
MLDHTEGHFTTGTVLLFSFDLLFVEDTILEKCCSINLPAILFAEGCAAVCYFNNIPYTKRTLDLRWFTSVCTDCVYVVIAFSTLFINCVEELCTYLHMSCYFHSLLFVMAGPFSHHQCVCCSL